MATGKEKFQLVFEAQEAASEKIKQLNKQLADLGGPQLVKAQNEIKKLTRQIDQLSGESDKSSGLFSKFTLGVAKGELIAQAATGALSLLSKGVGELGKAVMVAANVQELAGVLNFVGQRAGYTQEQLKGYTTQLRESGIAQKETNQALLRAVQGNIDLADAVKLGRIAQDAAVIGQMNSSEAYQTLIDAIVKGRVVMLKSLGIQGTFEDSYKRMSIQLHKNATDLTEAEKLQARLNLVMEGGEVISGAYETAMGSASKQLRSMDRLVQDLQVSVGQYFVPALSVLVIELSNVTKALSKGFGGDSKDSVDSMALSIGIFTAHLVAATKILFNFGQLAFNVMSMAVIAPIEGAITAVTALGQILSNPFDTSSWTTAGETMSNVFDGVVTDWNDIKGNLTDIDTALLQYAQTVAKLEQPNIAPTVEARNNLNDVIQTATVAVPAAIQESMDDMMDATEEQMKIVTLGVTEVGWSAERVFRVRMDNMNNLAAGMINNMVDQFMSGRASVGDIFKGMAMDFATYFIKTALSMLITTFLPGIGGILGGMFDTPVNDKMAADQGRDFMMWFQRGAMAQATGMSSLAVGLTQNTNSITPATPAGVSGGNTVMLNVTISGNVMSRDFVEKEIAPTLQRLVDDGRSQLSVQQENGTGERDVIIR